MIHENRNIKKDLADEDMKPLCKKLSLRDVDVTDKRILMRYGQQNAKFAA